MAMLRNTHYHQASDTIETLDLDFLTNICQSLIARFENHQLANRRFIFNVFINIEIL